LQLDEGGRREIGRFDLDQVARVEEEGLHHLAFYKLCIFVKVCLKLTQCGR
jgi:hypothetical protein